MGQWLLHVPAEVSKLNWQARIATLGAFALWTLWIWRGADIPAGESGSYLAWAAWAVWLQRARLSESLFAEEMEGPKRL